MAAALTFEANESLVELVNRAANGEELVISNDGEAIARVVPLPKRLKEPRKSGQNFSGITYISDDFDDPLPEEILKGFGY